MDSSGNEQVAKSAPHHWVEAQDQPIKYGGEIKKKRANCAQTFMAVDESTRHYIERFTDHPRDIFSPPVPTNRHT
jgi:hypothetical protein